MLEQRIISADSHVLEPHDVWLRQLPPRLHDTAPKIITTERGDAFVFADRKPWLLGVEFAAGDGEEMQERGRRWSDAPASGSDPHARIEAQDIDGVSCEIIYPTLGLYLYDGRPCEHQDVFFSAYNEWLADFCSAYPDRLRGVAMVSIQDVGQACTAIERAHSAGLAGIMIPTTNPQEGYHTEPFDPLWATAETLNMPISFHRATGEPVLHYRGRGAGAMNAWRTQANIIEPFVLLVLSGTYDRFPSLKTGFIEGGINWIGSTLDTLDDICRQHRWIQPKLKELPSTYWRRNCFATFERSHVGIELRRLAGVETLLWASDYPHAESTWPKSRAILAEDLDKVDEAEVRLIVSENCERIYRLGDGRVATAPLPPSSG